MSQQSQPQKDENQQQKPMKKPTTEWSMDLTSICGDGNGQNADLHFPTFDNLMTSLPSIVDDGIKDESWVELEQRELWQKFHPLVNEMIITKTGRWVDGTYGKIGVEEGEDSVLSCASPLTTHSHNFSQNFRRMFPALKVKLSGLEKSANYYVIMVIINCTLFSQMAFSIHFQDIVPCDSSRWKFHDSRWAVAGEAYPEMQNPALHIHPDSPASGEHWMEKGASFHRVKVTNNATLQTDAFVSSHRGEMPVGRVK